ncbi:MAG: serine/threonine protein kinase [Phycisphaeraceae bacterium]|nr:serine/threonine protein kinase [Phycisphaeraceae bacterium]
MKAILLEALDAPPDQRLGVVEALCVGDEALRAEVLALLNADPTGLGSPAAFSHGRVFAAAGGGFGLSPGTIPNYEFIEPLGEGGFGVVYLAEQHEPVKRRVALKVIKPGMDSKAVLGRFEAERQALAVMDHPNVAKVFDAGVTDRGLPFFAMEFVRGEPITVYSDNHRLGLDDRIALFLQVCEAVQHAHTKAIVHRDIKPSNILVSEDAQGRPSVKVIDFGVAKALNQRLSQQTIFTEHGQMIGTPEYMSPEQAEMSGLDIDTRTDVYSLGVVLYELLTGLLPFDPRSLRAAAFAEIQRIIRETDPPRPSTRLTASGESAADLTRSRLTDPRSLTHVLRGELDWVVMKCLEKDRARRYETPSALAGDLRRYLADEPVSARPPSNAYRLRKFVRRRRLEVGAGLVVLVALSAGLTIALWQAREAQRAASRERTQRVLMQETQGFWDVIVTKASAEYGSNKVTVLQALMYADAESRANTSGSPMSKASRQHLIGKGYLGLSEFRRASPILHEAVNVLEDIGECPPELLAEARWDAGHADRAMGVPGAIDRMQEALEKWTGLIGSDRPELWERMASAAALLAEDGRESEARVWLGRLRDARGRSQDPSESRYAGYEQMAMAQLANTLEEQIGHLREAIDCFTKAYGPTHWQTLYAKQLLGFTLSYGAHDPSGALAVFAETVQGMRTAFVEPTIPYADAIKEMAVCLIDLDRADEAEAAAAEAMEMYETLGESCHRQRTMDLLNGLYSMHVRLDHKDRAREIAVMAGELKARCQALKQQETDK